MTREDKIKRVKKYAKDLRELSEAYWLTASIAEGLSDVVLDGMVELAIAGDALHGSIAEKMRGGT